MHSDHVEGPPDTMQLRWHFNSGGPQVDLMCAEDTVAPAGHTMSCGNFSATIGDPLIAAGERAQRLAENPNRLPSGPSDLINLMTFAPTQEPVVVWQEGDVIVGRDLLSPRLP
tara:strand:- start:3961 stop:4299 length:339 start_codon:yes stop_codon:yes gene_type:complete